MVYRRSDSSCVPTWISKPFPIRIHINIYDVDKLKTISMEIRLIGIERLSEGLSRFGFEITVDATESHPYQSNTDRNRFRYPGVGTASVHHSKSYSNKDTRRCM